MSEEAKSSYAHALQGANDAQDQYYSHYLPDVLDRLKVIKTYLLEYNYYRHLTWKE